MLVLIVCVLANTTSIEIVFCVFSSMKFSRNNNGGDERDRTADPLLARQVLSQLSYAPTLK